MATAIAPQERAVADPYADLAAFFDRFADEEPRWKRRNSTYHRLIRRLTRFVVPPGARVLEIGSGSGDLLAALEPSSGVGVDVSRRMVERGARGATPSLRFEHAAGEELELGETFDYVVLSDLMPYVHDLLALFHRVAEHSHPGTRVVISSYSRAWRPIDPARRAAAAEAAQAAAQLGLAARRRQPARARRPGAGHDGGAHPLPEADPAADDLPERLRREHLAVQLPLPDVLDRRAAAPAPSSTLDGGLDRLPLPQRAGPRRAARRARARLRRADRADLRRGQLDRRHARRDPAPDRGAPRPRHPLRRLSPARARATPCAPASRSRSTTC